MTLRMALRAFATQPVRSAVLAFGFGVGIACMAGLLGVGEVILEQSRSPHLRGGGDLVIYGESGKLSSARFVTSQLLRAAPLTDRATTASPSLDADLYIFDGGRSPLRVEARGGIPSLERALGDPETSTVVAWRDTTADRSWASPDPASVLRAMDRFHPIPDVPARSDSWAEWLYFNGRAGENRFYLSFIVGPRTSPGRRRAGVRLQLERDGRMTSYVDDGEISEPLLLSEAPDITIGANRVQLDGMRYRITLSLYPQDGGRRNATAVVTGQLALNAPIGKSLPPFEIGGAGGWVSGYVVPVLTGELTGRLDVEGRVVSLDGGVGYHDHNWGFWEGVTWQWGQVAGDGLSLLYGKIRPPADAADPQRVPAFLIALGQDGPLGFTTDVTIDELDDPSSGQPQGIVVTGRGEALSLNMTLAVRGTTSTSLGGWFGDGRRGEFVQLRARYHVTGSVRTRQIDFTADGTAETFRGN